MNSHFIKFRLNYLNVVLLAMHRTSVFAFALLFHYLFPLIPNQAILSFPAQSLELTGSVSESLNHFLRVTYLSLLAVFYLSNFPFHFLVVYQAFIEFPLFYIQSFSLLTLVLAFSIYFLHNPVDIV